ncbi:MAG: rod shape-determining protein MreD [Eubacterium sp.]|jgi:rod shape-determining protein MreD|nr:rod shape-determining protein MreD [Eubacterium sp.]
MRRKLTVFLIIFVCFLLQTTLFQALALASISPNLLIVVVSSFGFMRGRKEGMYIGFVTGLVFDAFYGTIFGFYSLVFMYAGYCNGMFRKFFFPDDIKLPMLLICVSDIVYNIAVYVLKFMFRGQFHLDYYLMHVIVPELVYTVLIMIFLYPLLLKINQKLEAVEKRSGIKFV